MTIKNMMRPIDNITLSTITVIIALHKQRKEYFEWVDWIRANHPVLSSITFLIKDSGYNRDLIDMCSDFKNVVFISCGDSSIYDAWNQALDFVDTSYVMFLGVTDRLVVSSLQQHTTTSEEQKRKPNLIGLPFIFSNRGQLDFQVGDTQTLIKSFPARPGFCFSSAIFDVELCRSFRFNCEFKVLGDFEFLVRASSSIEFISLDTEPVVIFDMGGVSNRLTMFQLRTREYRRIVQSFQLGWLHFCVYYFLSFCRTTVLMIRSFLTSQKST